MAAPASSEATTSGRGRGVSRVPRKAQTESAMSRPHGTSLLIAKEDSIIGASTAATKAPATPPRGSAKTLRPMR